MLYVYYKNFIIDKDYVNIAFVTLKVINELKCNL